MLNDEPFASSPDHHPGRLPTTDEASAQQANAARAHHNPATLLVCQQDGTWPVSIGFLEALARSVGGSYYQHCPTCGGQMERFAGDSRLRVSRRDPSPVEPPEEEEEEEDSPAGFPYAMG